MKKKSIFAYIGLTTMVLGSLVSLPVSAAETDTNTPSQNIKTDTSTKNVDANVIDGDTIKFLDTPSFNFGNDSQQLKLDANGNIAPIIATSINGFSVRNTTESGYIVSAKLEDLTVKSGNNSKKLKVKTATINTGSTNESENGDGVFIGTGTDADALNNSVTAYGEKDGSSRGNLKTSKPTLKIQLRDLNGMTNGAYEGKINYSIATSDNPGN